jgi:TusA-related sulfurtransferase
MTKRVLRAAGELKRGDQVLLTTNDIVTVNDIYAIAESPGRRVWLELSNGDGGAIDSIVQLTVIAR